MFYYRQPAVVQPLHTLYLPHAPNLFGTHGSHTSAGSTIPAGGFRCLQMERGIC